MSVSVVVETITAREDTTGSLADGLCETLEALARQTVAPDEVIVVIDDLVDPSAADELRCRYPHAKLVTSAQSNYFAAKNAGVETATGEVVAMVDGDCVPEPDWLEMLLAQLVPGVDGVAGCTRYADRSFLARTFSVPDFSYVLEKDSASTGWNINNIMFRRDFFLRQPFDPRIRRNGGCYFLFHRLRAAGARIVYEPGARMAHGFPGGVAMLRKHFDRGYDGVTVYRLDEQCVLRGTRFFRRFGAIALVGITGRRILADWNRLARERRQIGIAAPAVPFFCALVVATRVVELVGGLAAIATPKHDAGPAAT